MDYQNAVELLNVAVAEVSQGYGSESLKSKPDYISLLKNDDPYHFQQNHQFHLLRSLGAKHTPSKLIVDPIEQLVSF